MGKPGFEETMKIICETRTQTPHHGWYKKTQISVQPSLWGPRLAGLVLSWWHISSRNDAWGTCVELLIWLVKANVAQPVTLSSVWNFYVCSSHLVSWRSQWKCHKIFAVYSGYRIPFVFPFTSKFGNPSEI